MGGSLPISSALSRELRGRCSGDRRAARPPRRLTSIMARSGAARRHGSCTAMADRPAALASLRSQLRKAVQCAALPGCSASAKSMPSITRSRVCANGPALQTMIPAARQTSAAPRLPGPAQTRKHCAGSVVPCLAYRFGVLQRVDQLVVPVDRQPAVRRHALDHCKPEESANDLHALKYADSL